MGEATGEIKKRKNSKNSRLNKIGTKLFIVMLFSIAASVAASVIALDAGSKQMVNVVLEDSVNSAMAAVLYRVEEMNGASLELAKKMAANASLIKAVEGGKSVEVKSAAQNVVYSERGTVDFVSVADKDGTVIARTHNDSIGDSIATHRNMVGALSGKTGTYIETGTKIRLSVISSAPVIDVRGNIIGAVAMGYQLDKEDFVDQLKSVTGTDITVFVGDERINTTIIKDGERQTGTTLSPEVADIVLGKMQRYHSSTTILGQPYYAAYEPIITNGDAVGIFFAGRPIAEIRRREKETTLIAVGTAFAVALIALILNRLITRKMIVKPVQMITEAAYKLAEGDLDIGNLELGSNDEIGDLGDSIKRVDSVLNKLVSELARITKEHFEGETSARMEETEFQGAYYRVAAGLNELVARYVKYMMDLCIVISEFGNGNFDVEYEQLPGKHGRANESVEQVRGLLKGVDSEIGNLALKATNGRLEARAAAEKFSGDWKHLLLGLNALMDAIVAPINEASSVLGEMSAGNLKTSMTGDYKGDFDIIKKSLNSTQNAISSYISEISDTLEQLSVQNLDIGIERNYIGDFSIIRDAINKIIETFNHVLKEFGSSAVLVANNSKHISDSSYSLAQGATEQSGAVEELNAVIAQVAAQTDKNAKVAEKASALAADVSEGAEKESELMESMLKAMEGINESSENISKIIKVIEDIAFQTNLLALNAAVEAARAGEHGKGFAVVAEEVRNLAARSQSAAKDTTGLIQGSIQKVSEGVTAANNASDGLTEIVSKISEISGYIETIANSSSEQNDSISQISIGISEVSQVTNRNTSISEECAASAEELSGQSELLRETITKFRLKQGK